MLKVRWFLGQKAGRATFSLGSLALSILNKSQLGIGCIFLMLAIGNIIIKVIQSSFEGFLFIESRDAKRTSK